MTIDQINVVMEVPQINVQILGYIGPVVVPQYGSGSPEGLITSRFVGDTYINQDNDVIYTNSKSGEKTGRQIFQTQPA